MATKYGEYRYVLSKNIKSYKDLLTDDWSEVRKLSKPELSAFVDYLSRIANRRLTEIENESKKTGYDFVRASLAYDSIKNNNFLKLDENGNRRFYYQGLDINGLRRMYSELNHFLNLKTSTVSGIVDVKMDLFKSIGLDYSTGGQKQKKRLLTDDVVDNKRNILTQSEEDLLWDVLEKLREKGELTTSKYGSDRAKSDITTMIKNKNFMGMSVDDLVKHMEKFISLNYDHSTDMERYIDMVEAGITDDDFELMEQNDISIFEYERVGNLEDYINFKNSGGTLEQYLGDLGHVIRTSDRIFR